MFITVCTPSSRRTGPTCRIAGCMSGANMKTIPVSAERRLHHRHRRVDRHAKRLEHVRAAALRRERAIAVLRDTHANPRDKQRRRRRDVERVDRCRRPCRRCRPAPRDAPLEERPSPVAASGRPPRARRDVSPLTRSPTMSAAICTGVASPANTTSNAAVSSAGSGASPAGEPFDRSEKRVGGATGH